ncbi:MAG: hypothetical protein AAF648_16345 [Pseudomonadota bacterium]
MKALLTGLAAIALITGCTAKGGYEFTGELGRSKAECETLISSSDRRACEESFQQSYEEYQKARAEVTGDD